MSSSRHVLEPNEEIGETDMGNKGEIITASLNAVPKLVQRRERHNGNKFAGFLLYCLFSQEAGPFFLPYLSRTIIIHDTTIRRMTWRTSER